MKIEVFKELHPYSIAELQLKLSLDEKMIKELLKSLSLMNITRRLSKNTSIIELEELFGADNFHDISAQIESEMFLFKYVGMLTIKNICLIIYPKYMDSYLEDRINGYKKLKQLIAVIRKYESKIQNQHTSMDDNNQYNALAITLSLVEDYLEHGLYTNDRQIIEENGYGEILWEKTIGESPVYFSDSIPVYLDLFTLNQESNEQDFFRQLHRIVISDTCNKLRDILKIIGVKPVVLTDSELSSLGGIEYIISRINQELGVQFVTRKQSLLKLIKSYITNIVGSQADDKISFVGTSSFNIVWEDVCSEVFGDCIDMSIKEMGLQYKGDKKYSTTLGDVVEKPLWTHKESGITHFASRTLTPDIVTVRDGKFSIYDAKYYRIKLDESGVVNYPGVGDISKQYLYELAYNDFIKENRLTMRENAFLMPTEDYNTVKIGSVMMEIFRGLRGINRVAIEIILLSSEEMFDEYLGL